MYNFQKEEIIQGREFVILEKIAAGLQGLRYRF